MKTSNIFHPIRILLSCFLIIYQPIVLEALVRKVSTAKQFQRALDVSTPGDVIELRSKALFEDQQFIASRSGDFENPIIITGSALTNTFASIKLNSVETTGLLISGDYWKIDGIELVISKPHIGLKIEGNHNWLSNLLVTGYETGVHISGNGNSLENCIINSTNGTGLYVMGNDNKVSKSVVEGSEWAMYFSSESKGSQVDESAIKGTVMIKGSHHLLKDDAIKGDLLISDCHNELSGVNAYLRSKLNYPEQCTSIDNLHITYAH